VKRSRRLSFFWKESFSLGSVCSGISMTTESVFTKGLGYP
jgi:hypothetical protein